jgi:hypothetical protein
MVIQTVSSRVESADSKQGLPSYDIVVIVLIRPVVPDIARDFYCHTFMGTFKLHLAVFWYNITFNLI